MYERFPRARIWRAATVLLPALALGGLGWRRRWICDDALIFTRAVREIVAGHGPNYNVGERAETSTSSLWQWLLALGHWTTGADPARLAVYGGLVLTVVGIAVALDGTWRLHDRSDARYLVPAGVFVLLALPPVWNYATSGLETGLGTLWIAGCWWLLVRASHDRRLPWRFGSAFVFGLGPLVRPDLGIVSVTFLVTLWILSRPGWRLTTAGAIVAGALPVLYEILRMGYYGVVVPLPGLAKEAGGSEVGRGWDYVLDAVEPYWLQIPLVAVLAGYVVLARREPVTRRALLITPLVSSVLMAAYVVKVGGDFMHARMLLPALFMLLLPVLVVPARRELLGISAVLLLAGVVTISPLRKPFDGTGIPGQTVNVRLDDIRLTGKEHPVSGEDWVEAFPNVTMTIQEALASGQPLLLIGDLATGVRELMLRPDAQFRIAVPGTYLGMVGEATPLDQRIVDLWSLAHPIGAHMDKDDESTLPGHEKLIDPVWIVADYMDPAAPVPSGFAPGAVAAARHALNCGELKELRESVREPMSFDRFWDNLTGAVGRTTLRVPSDPYEAEREFCGSGSRATAS